MFFLVMGLFMFTDCLPKTFEHVYDVECYREATQVIKPLFHKMSSLTVQLTGPAEILHDVLPNFFQRTCTNLLASSITNLALHIQRTHLAKDARASLLWSSQ